MIPVLKKSWIRRGPVNIWNPGDEVCFFEIFWRKNGILRKFLLRFLIFSFLKLAPVVIALQKKSLLSGILFVQRWKPKEDIVRTYIPRDICPHNISRRIYVFFKVATHTCSQSYWSRSQAMAGGSQSGGFPPLAPLLLVRCCADIYLQGYMSALWSTFSIVFFSWRGGGSIFTKKILLLDVWAENRRRI